MKIAPALLMVLALSACDSGYEKVTAVKLAIIDKPSNLLETENCRELWGNIQRFGLDMDKTRDDWNQVIVNSAYQLIEDGCVKQRRKN